MDNKIFDFEKGKNFIRVSIRDYKEYKFLDIREHYRHPDTSEPTPTKKGVTIPIESAADFVDMMYSLKEHL